VRGIVGAALLAAGLAACSNAPSALAPSPSVLATPTNAVLCRLPVSTWNYPNTEVGGGFVDYPGGAFTPEPTATMTSSAGFDQSLGPPVLKGPSGISDQGSVAYDTAQRRWLPVPMEWMAPGGGRYAYSLPNAFGAATGIHVVDVVTGADVLVPGSGTVVGDQANYTMGAFQEDGIYLTRFGLGGPRQGLWRLDLSTGRITLVGAGVLSYGVRVGGGAAWWGGADNGPPAAPGTLYRESLTPGAPATAWFTRTGLNLNVLGFDAAGQVLVEAYSTNTVELWQVSSQTTATRLASSTGTYDVPSKFYGGVAVDANGTWLGGSFGIFLLKPGGALVSVSPTAERVAGPCT
jgi:hypothetical protein